MPESLRPRLRRPVRTLVDLLAPVHDQAPVQPIHSDAHPANLLVRSEALSLVDFDDVPVGPPVQDLWPLMSGHDATAGEVHRRQLDAYDGLRALRFLQFATSIGKRGADPSSPAAFPLCGSARYWDERVRASTTRSQCGRNLDDTDV